ncbi:MAG: hypothetical protein P8075_15370 [Deltaproteobacteria bacterium]
MEHYLSLEVLPVGLARIFHESPAATADLAVLPGVLGCSFDKLRTSSPATYRSGTPRVQSRGTAGRLPGGTPILTVSRQQFMKHQN